MKTGVVLGRMQPIHNGHISLIRQACEENDKVFIFIGSANKLNKRNPIPIGLRKQLTEASIKEKLNEHVDKIIVETMNDLTDEKDNSHDWGFYLFTEILNKTDSKYFTMYYSDGFEIITTWFPSFILTNNISLKLVARNAEIRISSTEVRELITSGSKDEEILKKLQTVLPDAVSEKIDTIKEHIAIANQID